MKFNNRYTQYWRDAVRNPIDGIQIAGRTQVMKMLEGMAIQRSDKVLDLGCSYGRLFEALHSYSDNIFGVDPEKSAVQEANSCGYKEVHVGVCEHIPFVEDFFDHIICWAVFEVVDQEKCLVEANRTLCAGGKFLFSGKNTRYNLADNAAFTAEKNAYLKEFKQNFTDLQILIRQLHKFGFKLNEVYTFANRGDLALDVTNNNSRSPSLQSEFYEFVVILEKIESIVSLDLPQIEPFSFRFSKTCREKARNSNFDSVPEYFNSIGIS